jgi:hypothetical protein
VLEEQSSQTTCDSDDKVAKLSDFIKKRYELSLSEPVLDAEEIFAKMAARHKGGTAYFLQQTNQQGELS